MDSVTRNTPTHVGKTSGSRWVSTHYQKHPHARGEDSESKKRLTFLLETPPRTWGRPTSRAYPRHGRRNTPTHVGKTKRKVKKDKKSRKHPHARGEDPLSAPRIRARLETPPRTWGRLIRKVDAPHTEGNTPTHVGKTLFASSSVPKKRKHPHARGEDASPCAKQGRRLETPPRTWGRRKSC